MHSRAWALHDAVFELARDHGLSSYRVECKLAPSGETMVSLFVALPEEQRSLPPGYCEEDPTADAERLALGLRILARAASEGAA